MKAELWEEQTAGGRRSKGSWRSPVGELLGAGRWCRRAECECVGGRTVSLYTLREPHRPYFCCRRHHLLCCCPWIFQGGITHRHKGCIWNRSTKWAPGATSGPVPSSHSLSLSPCACPADQSLFLLFHWFSTGFKTLILQQLLNTIANLFIVQKHALIQTLLGIYVFINGNLLILAWKMFEHLSSLECLVSKCLNFNDFMLCVANNSLHKTHLGHPIIM